MSLIRETRPRSRHATARAGRAATFWKPGAVSLLLLVLVVTPAASALGAPLKVGDTIPGISLPDLRGNRVDLPEDTRGRVILIHFFATWCPYCVKEIAALEALYELYGAKGFIPFSINVGEGREVVEPYLARAKATYPVLLDSKAVSVKACGVTGIPTTLICDGNGVVLHKIIGEVGRTALERLLETVFRQ